MPKIGQPRKRLKWKEPNKLEKKEKLHREWETQEELLEKLEVLLLILHMKDQNLKHREAMPKTVVDMVNNKMNTEQAQDPHLMTLYQRKGTLVMEQATVIQNKILIDVLIRTHKLIKQLTKVLILMLRNRMAT